MAISNAASIEAGATPEIVQQAMNVLVRKAYRKQTNRNAVGQAALEDLRSTEPKSLPDEIKESVDDDWLNIFERYAEDASSERMQKLWGRVLAGEIRKSGSYSMRTLRFLSEFSQADALAFSDFCNSAFCDSAPKNLVKPDKGDIRNLIYLESSGLIKGTEGLGIERIVKFNDNGYAFNFEKELGILFKGEPNTEIRQKIIPLTPLGQELLSLLPARNPKDCARRVAHAFRAPEIIAAYLARYIKGKADKTSIEILWEDDLESKEE